MVKQKVYSLLENLDQLSNLNIGFAFLLIFSTDIYSNSLFFLNQILIAQAVLHYLELTKLQLAHKILYQLLKILLFDLLQQFSTSLTQFLYQFRSRFISQLMKGISRVLLKLLRDLHGIIISTSFVEFLFV